MNLLRRSKKNGMDGFKDLVRSLESSAPSKRIERFERLAIEDPVYMDWIARNLLGIKDILDLDSQEFELVIKELKSPGQMLFRAFNKTPFEKFLFQGLPKGIISDYEDEKERGEEIKLSMRIGAQLTLIDIVRNLQNEGEINGVIWHLPEAEIVNLDTPPAQGKFESTYQNKVLALKGEIKKTKRTGTWEHYFPNGVLFAIGDYEVDQKIGPWKIYYPNGKLKSEGVFTLDTKSGDWTFYDHKGEKTVQNMDK